jgi:hypothetical protein
MNRRDFSQFLASSAIASLAGCGGGGASTTQSTNASEAQTSSFGYGGVASNQDQVNTITQAFSPFVALPATGLPAQVDNAVNGKLPPIGNQGIRGTCTAWGVGYAMATYREAHVNNKDARLVANQASPEDLYIKTLLQRTGTGLNCMEDGLGIVEAIEVLKRSGIASMKDIPYDGGACQIRNNSAPIYSRFAEIHGLQGQRFSDTLYQIKKEIYDGKIVVFGMNCFMDFQSYWAQNSSNAIYVEKSFQPNYNSRGQQRGHTMCICGYDDFKRAVKVMNSWGEVGGDRGFVWIDYETLGQVIQNGSAFSPYLPSPDVIAESNQAPALNVPVDASLSSLKKGTVAIQYLKGTRIINEREASEVIRMDFNLSDQLQLNAYAIYFRDKCRQVTTELTGFSGLNALTKSMYVNTPIKSKYEYLSGLYTLVLKGTSLSGEAAVCVGSFSINDAPVPCTL